MNFSSGMQTLDWCVFGATVVGLISLLIYCQRFSRSISDFLSASRCAGRYLLCVAQGAISWDVIGAVAVFEMFYEAGFTSQWWAMLTGPTGLILSLFGWVTYRLRETRCYTVAQFFEVRYSRRFRICAGIITWLSGVVNFGIFPAISIRFIMFFCQFPEHIMLGGINVDVYLALLIAYVSMAASFAVFGGQIAIMITDFMQAAICNLSFIAFIFFIFKLGDWDITGGMVSWDQMSRALDMVKPGMSQVNPYDCSKLPDFNMWYFLIGIFGSIYGRGTWQGTMGYASAALTPHEGQMAGRLGTWRGLTMSLLLTLFPLAVIVFMRCPEFAPLKEAIEARLQLVESPQLRSQGLVPVAMSLVLPVGMVGLFLSVMFAGMVSTDDSYMHSWGSIFIQDVLMPFKKKPFTPEQHLRALRLSIVGVGIFAVAFSYFFRQTEYIFMFFAITGAIISGAGAVMIGGLYWKYGTTLAAWVTYLLGSVLAVSGIIIQQVWRFKDGSGLAKFLNDTFHWEWVAQNMNKFPLNGRVMSFYIMLCCLAAYVGISLLQHALKKAQVFNLEKMLHRGIYDVHNEHQTKGKTRFWERLLGFTPEFSFGDKCISIASIAWTIGWFLVFLIFTIAYFAGASTVDGVFIGGVSQEGWKLLWKWKLYIILVLGITCTLWLAAGGFIDMIKLFKRLKTMVRNDADNGSVQDGSNAE